MSRSPRFEQFVSDRVQSGQYANRAEVPQAGLRLLEGEEEARLYGFGRTLSGRLGMRSPTGTNGRIAYIRDFEILAPPGLPRVLV